MLFIFDWDGTLCDSTGKITHALHESMADLGFPKLPDQTVKSIIGLGLPEALRVLIPDIDAKGVDAMRERYVHHYEEVDRTPPPLFEGALETLEQLLGDNHDIAIATGKTRRGLDKMLKDLELSDLFQGSRCADETRSKPHPQMLNELLREFGVTANHALMIGDTSFDLEMAHNAGVRSVAALYGAHPVERLKPFSPVANLERISDLLKHEF